MGVGFGILRTSGSGGGGGGTTITSVANYSALPLATSVPNRFFWCENSQGTKWLPGSLGGTYYPLGMYYSNGITWEYAENPYQATLATVNAGTNTDQFVSPYTFTNADKWNSYVPYVGAIANVDLGTYNLTADHITLNVNPSGAGFVVGSTEWNNTDGTSETLLKGGNVVLKNGVDLVARVVNNTGINLTKAAYQVVKVSGAQGQRLAVNLAQANNDANSADTLGVVVENINNNLEGFILTVGQLLNVNTTGSLQGESWTDGDVLYLSPTIAGAMTNVKPNGLTGHIVVLGYVEYAHANNGKIYVKIMNGWELDELHNVYINNPINNNILSYVTPANLWENRTLGQVIGGVASQYVRGDGSVATFPTSTGGGSSVAYYLNGGTSQGTIGGNAYYQMSKSAVIGTNADFSLTNTTGYIAQFITDVNDPSLLSIPQGAWNFSFYFNASDTTSAGSFYVELYKYNGTTFTLISSSSTNPELITNGTAIDLYTTSTAVPLTTLAVTDRLAVRIFVNTNGNKTITLHTQDSHLCEIITTFSTGINTLNGLSSQVQYFSVGTSGTDFNISSATDTHTFNLPFASATNSGKLSSTDWSTFNNKQDSLTIGDISDIGTDGITITGGTGAIIGSGVNISQQVASANQNGYLSSTDWVTFNSSNFIPKLDGSETYRGININNNSTTVVTDGGITMSSTASTLAQSVASTNFSTKQIRLRYYASVVSSGKYTGTRGSALLWYVHGGFKYVCDFNISDTAYSAGCQQFYGLAGQTTDLAYGGVSGTLVSTLTNIIGVGSEVGDTNLQVFHNDGSGTATKIDLGIDFPSNRTAGAISTTVYSIQLYNEPMSTDVKYEVKNNETGSLASGTISLNLPLTTQGLNFFASRCMSTTSVTNTGQFDLSKLGVYSLL